MNIRYIYEDEFIPPNSYYFYNDESLKEDMAGLPFDLILKMKDALAVADLNLLKKLITGIEKEKSQLARHLMALSRNLDYDQLQNTLNLINDER